MHQELPQKGMEHPKFQQANRLRELAKNRTARIQYAAVKVR